VTDGWTIDVDGLDEAQKRTARLAAFLLDLRWFWPRVSTLFIGWMREQFESEGAFGGDPWAPLSPGYLAWKLRLFPGKGILHASGDLRRAASLPTRRATPTELILRIEDPKLQYHQTGTTRMPARPLIFDRLPPVALRELEDVAEEEAAQLVRRLGL
jgi:hypothetical protein